MTGRTAVSLRAVPILTFLAARAFAFGGLPKEARRAAELIVPGSILGPTRFLSSDALQGRMPATPGDALAQSYIATQFEALDLQPFGTKGSWLQEFDLVGISTQAPAHVDVRRGNGRLTLKAYDDLIVSSRAAVEGAVDVRGAELVFVGHGIVAPEYKWDDYKDADLKGKILVYLNNEPTADAALFAGKTRLYYGRWSYKYEMAQKKKAAGAIIIHTAESAGYPWKVVQSSFSGEQFYLPTGAEEQPLALTAWISEAQARKLAELAGKNLDELRALAQKRDFRPVPLGAALSVGLKNKTRRVKTANVLGVLPGSDAKLKGEYVLYTAHHDHLGVCEPDPAKRDRICNGALDNATGVAAMLGIARGFATLPKADRPRRSILFVATGAEEQGMLGSEYFAKFPPVHPAKISAAINIDGLGIFGKTKDVVLIGKGKTNLDAILERLAKDQGRVLRDDPAPEQGSFYRSDQFNLAKIGVPAAYLDAGIELIGRPEGWGKEQRERWANEHYHQPSDEVRGEWNLAGAVEDIQLLFALGYTVAHQDALAQWTPGDEFELVRMRALQELESIKSSGR